MDKNRQPESRKKRLQWQNLLAEFLSLDVIEPWFIEAQLGRQDMCFLANAAHCRWGKIVLANFAHAIRKLEEPYYELWFNKYRLELFGFTIEKLPPEVRFEGQGDVVTVDLPEGPALLMGYGSGRTDYEAAKYLAEIYSLPQEQVLPLRLVDPRFYHLDTACVYIQSKNLLVYYPGAFDSTALRALRSMPVEHYEVSEEDAVRFVCNGVFVVHEVDGVEKTVFITAIPTQKFIADLESRDIEVRCVDMSEFLKSGGSVRCLTLFLPDEHSQVPSRTA